MKIMVLDIGGTAIKSGVFENGSISHILERPTEAMKGGPHVMETAKSIIREYREQFSFDRIGISTAGQVNPVEGSIIYANKNIPGYTGTRIKEIMESEFALPTAVENDVNSAAIGEARFGAGRGQQNFVCLTYGTGVGGAAFINGELYSGSSFSAGEFGAIVTHPEDRRPSEDMFSGCYEKYASTTALVARAVRLDPSLDNGRAIFRRMQEPEVRQVIDDWIQEVVYGLITVVHMLNPSCLVLGGGVMEQPYVTEQLPERLYENIMSSFRRVEIKRAELGNQAGLLGAAVRAMEL